MQSHSSNDSEIVRFQFHGDFEVGRRSFTVNSFVARPVTVLAKSPITHTVLRHELSVGGTMDVLDFPYHQHTTNRWGPVASMDLTPMTTDCHAHYQLTQVSDFEAASISSPTLQANGLEGESKVSVVIPSSPGLGYSDTDLLHQTHACLAYATLQSTAHRYSGIMQEREYREHECHRTLVLPFTLDQVKDVVLK